MKIFRRAAALFLAALCSAPAAGAAAAGEAVRFAPVPTGYSGLPVWAWILIGAVCVAAALLLLLPGRGKK